MSIMRLQKFLANAGVSSRRKAEELIAAGRVKVNGNVVTELGTRIDDAKDVVTVSGKKIEAGEKIWIALNKPRGYLSTRKDPQGRPTVYDLLPPAMHGLFYVGRLDLDSEGLLLLTNDGDTANLLLHPRYEVERVYEVLIRGQLKPDRIEALLQGVELDDGVATAQSVRVLGVVRNEMRLRIALREGKKREVRRMLWAVGHKVLQLKRISYGPIRLDRLPEGKWRKLSEEELSALPGGKRQKPQRRGAPRDKRAVDERAPDQRTRAEPASVKRGTRKSGPTGRGPVKRGAMKRGPAKRGPTKRGPTKRGPGNRPTNKRAPHKRAKRD